MATNRSMLGVLTRGTELIDEINAINRLLKKHLTEQKKQPSGKGETHKYRYNKKRKSYFRVPK